MCKWFRPHGGVQFGSSPANHRHAALYPKLSQHFDVRGGCFCVKTTICGFVREGGGGWYHTYVVLAAVPTNTKKMPSLRRPLTVNLSRAAVSHTSRVRLACPKCKVCATATNHNHLQYFYEYVRLLIPTNDSKYVSLSASQYR